MVTNNDVFDELHFSGNTIMLMAACPMLHAQDGSLQSCKDRHDFLSTFRKRRSKRCIAAIILAKDEQILANHLFLHITSTV